MTLQEYLAQFGLQLATDVKDVDFDGSFHRGIDAFSRGLQPGSLSYYERKGYDAAQQAFRLLQKRREEGLADYRQTEFKFN